MRKNAIRRITAFSLALLLLMLPLCSCNQSADTTDTTVSTIATVDDKNDNWSHVPDVDLGGRTFNILRGRAVVPEAYNGEPINDTMYECVLYINDRFNVDIVSVASSTESASDDMLAAQMAGLTAYDLVYPHPTIGIQAFLTTGLLTNLKENQYISLNGPWYNQSFVNNYTTNGKLYILASDLTIAGQPFFGLIYNTEKLQNLGYDDDFYEKAYDKKWTIDAYTQIIKETKTIDEGGDNQEYGFIYNSLATHHFMIGMGQEILVKNGDDQYEFAFNASRLSTITEKFAALVYGTDNVLIDSYGNAALPTSKAWQAFSSGHGLFMNYDLGSCYTLLRDLEFDIGYLPLPILNEGDEINVFCAGGFLGIPQVVYNADESSIIFEAMSIYSYEKLRPQFFESILLGRLSKKEADYEMLEFLHQHKEFNAGFTYDFQSHATNILYKIVVGGNGNGGTKAVTTYLKGYSNYFETLVNNANSME